MNDFYKSAAVVIIGLLLCLIVSGHKKEFSAIITIFVCVYLCYCAVEYLEPLISYSRKLRDLAGIDNQVFTILLKSSGIGILTEIITLICADAGFASIGKILQMVSCLVILWLSIPLFSSLLELIEHLMLTV